MGCDFCVWDGTGWVYGLLSWVFGFDDLCWGRGGCVLALEGLFGLRRTVFGLGRGGFGLVCDGFVGCDFWVWGVTGLFWGLVCWVFGLSGLG